MSLNDFNLITSIFFICLRIAALTIITVFFIRSIKRISRKENIKKNCITAILCALVFYFMFFFATRISPKIEKDNISEAFNMFAESSQGVDTEKTISLPESGYSATVMFVDDSDGSVTDEWKSKHNPCGLAELFLSGMNKPCEIRAKSGTQGEVDYYFSSLCSERMPQTLFAALGYEDGCAVLSKDGKAVIIVYQYSGGNFLTSLSSIFFNSYIFSVRNINLTDVALAYQKEVIA